VANPIVRLSGQRENSPMSLIQDCVRYIVERSGGIDRFVLLVDESKWIQEELQTRLSAPIFVHDVLKKAILAFPISCGNGSVLETNLVMSCLDINALRPTDSGREIRALLLPNALNSADIWDKWASVYLPADFVSQVNANMDYRQIEILLFANVASIPRAVECSIFEMKRVWLGKVLDKKFKLSSSAIRGILSSAMDAVYSRYSIIANADLSPNIMRAILFKKRIDLKGKTMKLISSCALTNSLNFIGTETGFVPQSNLLSVYFNAKF